MCVRTWLSVLVLLVCTSVSMYGQAGFGLIAGRVADPSAAVVPNAKVTVTNDATGVKTETLSNGEGDYRLLQLQPGTYTLTAETQGFKKAERRGILLQVDDRLTINIALEVGTEAQTVMVEGEAPLLRTQDAETGEVINNRFIETLPQLQRDPLQLLVLSGNVQGDGSRAGGGSDTRINGGRTSGVEYLVDGITAGNGGHTVSSNAPLLDSVAEFKVITNGIAAEYGRISGGAVEIVTLGGTNQYHGQLFEYFQNDHLNANSWQQNSLGGKKTPFRQNDFGFALGGPLDVPKLYRGRDRTFFFVNYEGRRFSQAGNLQVASVPTAAERSGDFSKTFYGDATTLIFDPNSPQIQGTGADTGHWVRTQLIGGGDGKHVPASMIAPIVADMFKLVPLPTPGYGPSSCSSCNNFVGPQNTKNQNDFFSTRLDQNITQYHRIFVRFSTGNIDNGQSNWYGPLGVANEFHEKQDRRGTINYSGTLSPTLLISARAGVDHNPAANGRFSGSKNTLPYDSVTKGLIGDQNADVIVTFMGYTALSQSSQVSDTAYTTYNAGVALTKVLARHTVKFGYEHRRYYDNFSQGPIGYNYFQQNPISRYAEDNDWNNQAFTNSLASAMIGKADWWNAFGPSTQAANFNYHAAFVQDDFKFSPKLTVNAGVRWDVETPTTERHDKLYFWDGSIPSDFHVNPGYDFKAALVKAGLSPDLPTPSWVTNGFPKGAIRIAHTPEFPSRSGTTVNPHQFAPRLGLAYQINPKTVFRGSFGMMYLSTSGNPNGMLSGGAGISTSDAATSGWHPSNDGLRHLLGSWDNPYYYPSDITHYERDNKVANYQSTGSVGPGAWNRNSHMPYELTWNLGIQRELPNKFLLETNYSANRGVKLLAPDLISRFPKPLLQPGNAAAMTTLVDSPTAGQTRDDAVVGKQQLLAFLYFPMPYYGTVNVLGTNYGSSTYHSLNVRLERRFAQGISFLLNYTLSRSLDNVGGPEPGNGCICNQGNGFKNVQSVDNFAGAWGLSAYDETHRLLMAYSAELPFGRGKKFLSDPKGNIGKTILDYVVGGWAVSGFSIYRSGRPVILSAANINLNNNIRVEQLYGSFTSSDHNIGSSAFKSDSQVLVSSQSPITDSMVRRFDSSKVTGAQSFTYGNLPPVFDNIRNPGNSKTDLAMMKKFPIRGESKYFQLRLEAQNAFNQRGWGSYNTTIGDPHFGLIQSAGPYGPRIMQVSARLFF
jgi:hypothetical protein